MLVFNENIITNVFCFFEIGIKNLLDQSLCKCNNFFLTWNLKKIFK